MSMWGSLSAGLSTLTETASASLSVAAEQAAEAAKKASEAAAASAKYAQEAGLEGVVRDATVKATEGAKNAQETLIKTYEDAQADFAKEDASNSLLAEKNRQAKVAAVPLWTISTEDQAILENELKQQILQISTEEKNFTECPLKENEDDPDFPFSVDACEAWALEALKCDSMLEKTRYRLVRPQMLSDHAFWRAYFYKVFQLRTALGLEQLFDPNETNPDAAKKAVSNITQEEEEQFSNDLQNYLEEEQDETDIVKVEKDGQEEGQADASAPAAEGDAELELENLEEMLADVSVDEIDDGDMEAELNDAISADLP